MYPILPLTLIIVSVSLRGVFHRMLGQSKPRQKTIGFYRGRSADGAVSGSLAWESSFFGSFLWSQDCESKLDHSDYVCSQRNFDAGCTSGKPQYGKTVFVEKGTPSYSSAEKNAAWCKIFWKERVFIFLATSIPFVVIYFLWQSFFIQAASILRLSPRQAKNTPSVCQGKVV